MADDLESRLQQEIDRLNAAPAQGTPGTQGTITILNRSPSPGAASMKTFQIHSNAPSASAYDPAPSGGSATAYGQTSGEGNAAAQAHSDYLDDPTDAPLTGDAPYTSPFSEPRKSPFSFPRFQGGADAERVLRIALWVITAVGILAILLNFRAVTDTLFVFFAELLVSLSSFLLVIGIIVAAAVFLVSRFGRRRWRW